MYGEAPQGRALAVGNGWSSSAEDLKMVSFYNKIWLQLMYINEKRREIYYNSQTSTLFGIDSPASRLKMRWIRAPGMRNRYERPLKFPCKS